MPDRWTSHGKKRLAPQEGSRAAQGRGWIVEPLKSFARKESSPECSPRPAAVRLNAPSRRLQRRSRCRRSHQAHTGRRVMGSMSAEASALLKDAQVARQQAKRARRLAGQTLAPDIAAQLRKYADELDQKANALEERAVTASMPKPAAPAESKAGSKDAAQARPGSDRTRT